MPSRLVFHYTSLEGFKGIVENRSIWASDVRYLNDYLEVENGKKWISHFLDDELFDDTFGKFEYRDELQATLQDFIDQETTCFAACFCDEADKLSQWRGYGSGGYGIALGFNTDNLERHFSTNLRQVEYNEDSVIKNIEKSLRRTVAKLRKVPIHDGELTKEFAALSQQLVEICLTSKSEAFSEEKERRLFWLPDTSATSNVRYRIKGTLLIPYVTLELKSSWPDIIEEIWIGPTLDANAAWRSVKEFAMHNNLRNAEIKHSSAPYRTS